MTTTALIFQLERLRETNDSADLRTLVIELALHVKRLEDKARIAE